METKTNYFNELSAIDVSKHTKKKGKFSYLSWAWAVKKLREKYPTATWEMKRFGEQQLPYLHTELGYFVEVAVTVNEVTLSQIHPVLDNLNHPVMKPNSFQINTSLQRCLAKAIALHGLGLCLYADEDLPEEATPQSIDQSIDEDSSRPPQVTSNQFGSNPPDIPPLCEKCGKTMYLDKNGKGYYYCYEKTGGCGHKYWPQINEPYPRYSDE